jgi:heat shock protein HslJ
MFLANVLCAMLLTASASAKSPLEATPWHLVELNSAVLAPNNGVTLLFDGSNVSGSASCNRISGGYVAEGNSLNFQALTLTRMACADATMKQEDQLVQDLEKTTAYKIVDGKLRLTDGKKTLAIFEPTTAQSAYRVKPLHDKVWPVRDR